MFKYSEMSWYRVFVGLELGHEYKIDVLAINELGKTWDEQQFSAKTAGMFRI